MNQELFYAYNEIRTLEKENYGESYYTKKDVIEDYNDLIQMIKEPIYRAIKLKDVDDLNYTQLGVYWTNDVYSAKSYEGQSGDDYIIKAMATIVDVDIANTIILRRLYPENEIRLESGRQIKVLNILKNNKPLNISGYFFT